MRTYGSCGKVLLEQDDFGYLSDKVKCSSAKVKKFTWKNSFGVIVQAITYGATITSIKLPGKDGMVADIVMGFNDMKGYLNPLNPYFGSTVGRVANRVGKAQFSIDGVQYKVTANHGANQLHGGFKGFDKVVWDYHISGTKVVMSYDSTDGEEGYPGNVLVNVTYELNNENEFLINYLASTTKPTFINLTNHSYFNLAGHNSGAGELYKHAISINADNITEVDADSVPTGKLLPVENTAFDLRIPKILGDVILKIPNSPGYDHNFCVNKCSGQEMTSIASVTHPPSGRSLEILSNQPGVQFYTSNFIPEDPSTYSGDKSTLQTLEGKEGNYYKHGALCLETQNYPDAINHQNFPKAVLYPGELYKHSVIFRMFYTI